MIISPQGLTGPTPVIDIHVHSMFVDKACAINPREMSYKSYTPLFELEGYSEVELLNRVKDMFETKFRLIKESNSSFLGNDPETLERTVLFVEEQIMLAMNSFIEEKLTELALKQKSFVLISNINLKFG